MTTPAARRKFLTRSAALTASPFLFGFSRIAAARGVAQGTDWRFLNELKSALKA